jgi:hypothetical protein
MIRKPILTLAALLLSAGLFAGCANMNNGTADRDLNNDGLADDGGTFGTQAVRNGNRDGRFWNMNRDGRFWNMNRDGRFGTMNRDGRYGTMNWDADDNLASSRSVSQLMRQRLAQAGFANSEVLVIGDNIFVIEGSKMQARGIGVQNGNRLFGNGNRFMNNDNRGMNNGDGLFGNDNRMYDNRLFGNENGDNGVGIGWLGGVNADRNNGLFNRRNGNGRLTQQNFTQQNVSVLGVLKDEFSGMRVYRIADEEGKQALRRLERNLSALTAEDVDEIVNDLRTVLNSVVKVNTQSAKQKTGTR